MKWLLAVLCGWLMFTAVHAVVPGRVVLNVRFDGGP